MDAQWDDMKVFLAVARESSLAGAGRILKMDPATGGGGGEGGGGRGREGGTDGRT